MNLTTIEQMDAIYFLDRNAWNVNDREALVVEMEIIEERGKLLAYAEQGHHTIQFELTDQLVSELTKGECQHLFESRKKALAHYDDEIQKAVQAIHDTPKDALVRKFFQSWLGETIHDSEIHQAMKAKIKAEFGVDV
ncbi:hypothetical protein [Metabacillus sp. SLBN-84]